MIRRLACCFCLICSFIPGNSAAISLQWSDGSGELTFAVATRCTLQVRADSAEVTLPGQWRLIWIADSSGAQFVSMDSLDACLSDSAKAFEFAEPATAADSAAHQATARYCSAGSDTATIALAIVDLEGGGRGKFKVVALDPTDPDSSRVIESNEVIYNGGVEGSYPPTVLHATSVHQSLVLQVTAVGSDLQIAQTMTLMGTDSTWTLPLSIVGQTPRG